MFTYYIYILSTGTAYLCTIADNDFLKDPHDLAYEGIQLTFISLYVLVPWPCMLLVYVLKHILGGNKNL